jgi:hypothetical protein
VCSRRGNPVSVCKMEASERSLCCKVECLSTIVDSKEHINGLGEAMGDIHLAMQQCTCLS